jgi:hypothetical protein
VTASALRIGILGAARIAPKALVQPAREVAGVTLRAVAARDATRAASFAAKHGIPVVHPSYAALLEDPEIDAVYNPLPNGLHGVWTDRALMAEIVKVHHPDITDRVLDNALEVFFGLRQTPKLRKKPSTSELIDWICALKKAGVDLAKVGHGIPFLGTLLKTEADVELVSKRAKA